MEYLRTITALLQGKHIDRAAAADIVGALLEDGLEEAQAAALLTALASRLPTYEELLGFAHALQIRAVPFFAPQPCLDTCGTGGSGLSTINTSTLAAFVIAAAGARLAKHGNRAATGKCGSMDVLESLDVPINLPPRHTERLLGECGIAFLYAPRFHPAVGKVGTLRRSLGFRTVFNLIGPLVNPAGAVRRVLGVSDPALGPIMRDALAGIGVERALVVSGADGLDEITLTTTTRIWELDGSNRGERSVHPTELGLAVAHPSAIQGGDVSVNRRVFLEVITGRDNGPHRDLVALNAGAGLLAYGLADSLASGVSLALEKLQSRAALEKFEVYRERAIALTQEGTP
jgi:anthranilate phosphoribosyltransferase